MQVHVIKNNIHSTNFYRRMKQGTEKKFLVFIQISSSLWKYISFTGSFKNTVEKSVFI